LARELGDPNVIGEALTYSAVLTYRRQAFAQAEDLLDEAFRMLGERATHEQDVLPFFFSRGDFALAQGQVDRAAHYYEVGLDHFREIGNEWGVRDVQAGLAAVRYWTGDVAGAARLYWESLQRSQEMNYWSLVASSLLGLAAVALASGQPEDGARLLGAAEGNVAALGMPIFTRDLPLRERIQTLLIASLGPERLAAAWEAGQALSLEAAIDEARAVAAAVTASS
jgi:hypothetical protein